MITLAITLLVSLLIGYAIYIGVPTIVVRISRVDYVKRQVVGRFIKVDPNHALIVLRGGKKVRALIGVNYRLYRGDVNTVGEDLRAPIELDGDRGLWIVPRKPHEKEEIGCYRDPIVWFIDSWFYDVTGYRVIGATLNDLFGARLASYDLARPPHMPRHTTDPNVDDISYYADLNKQVVPYLVKNADTGGTETIELPDGTPVKYRSAVEVTETGQVNIVVVNLDMVFFGVNRYFTNLDQVVTSALVEATRGANADNLRDTDWVRIHLDPAPLLKNGTIPVGLLPFYKDQFEITPETVEDKGYRSRWDKANTKPGTVTDFGFVIAGSRNDAIEFDDDFKAFLAQVQQNQREIERDLRRAQGDVAIATLEMEADFKRARGKAAYTKEELAGVTEGARALSPALADDVAAVSAILVAAQNVRAVINATGGATVFVQAPQGGPSPVIDVSPKDKGGATTP